ncbi:hypothetical protein BDP27DRAFT_1237471, partial [Rhodocollybia butyracea]
FGRDTIQKIHKNVSEMRNLAARDYEDFLQVYGLTRFHLNALWLNYSNRVTDIQDLLFDLNAFEAFAKFRLHSNLSLDMLNNHTTFVGKSLRKFKNKVAPAYTTKETPKERTARQRRQSKAEDSGKKRKATNDAGSHVKLFNLSTYKIHAMGYYAQYIRCIGTTDNYSTATVTLSFFFNDLLICRISGRT